LLGLCLALKQVGKLRWARNVGWPTLWSRLGLLWLWRLRVTLGSRLGRIALRLLWLCVLRLLGSLLLGRLGISLRSLLACKGAILCLGYSRNTAGQDRLFLAGIDLLRVKRNIELDTRLAAVVSFVLARVKCSVCFL
jgi:hypothetical protein